MGSTVAPHGMFRLAQQRRPRSLPPICPSICDGGKPIQIQPVPPSPAPPAGWSETQAKDVPELLTPLPAPPSAASPVPAHLQALTEVEHRYPGIIASVRKLEEQAEALHYTPADACAVEQRVLAAPPWSLKPYPSRIFGWVEALRARRPDLDTTSVEAFDVKAAERDCNVLARFLESTFPQRLYPDIGVAARVKAPDSLQGKIADRSSRYQGYVLASVPDTVAGRVDVPDLETMGIATMLLEERLGDRVLDKLDYMSKPSVNGYRAVHYIVEFGDRAVEVQVTTRNLRLADLATHDTLYKQPGSNELDSEAREALADLADKAMFVDGQQWLNRVAAHRS
jgi:hypothetical protein